MAAGQDNKLATTHCETMVHLARDRPSTVVMLLIVDIIINKSMLRSELLEQILRNKTPPNMIFEFHYKMNETNSTVQVIIYLSDHTHTEFLSNTTLYLLFEINHPTKAIIKNVKL
ncbi:hypothetical protein T10_10867 [Trichinella papuae]|uniref:Uncharacterized protein n=1 Tax=Trichinella papuae TaxID=268474 RepID=A0A0V1N6D0_9BILA|nr:hypothetical protein T10_10867 [Trichinella papuae]